jgi:hypothetical protein
MPDARADARSTGWTWIAAIWCAGALFNASETLLTMHAVGVGKAWHFGEQIGPRNADLAVEKSDIGAVLLSSTIWRTRKM